MAYVLINDHVLIHIARIMTEKICSSNRRCLYGSSGKPDGGLQKAGGAGSPDARVFTGAHPWDHRTQRLGKDHIPLDDLWHRRADRGGDLSRRQARKRKGDRVLSRGHWHRNRKHGLYRAGLRLAEPGIPGLVLPQDWAGRDRTRDGTRRPGPRRQEVGRTVLARHEAAAGHRAGDHGEPVPPAAGRANEGIGQAGRL